VGGYGAGCAVLWFLGKLISGSRLIVLEFGEVGDMDWKDINWRAVVVSAIAIIIVVILSNIL